MEFTDVAPVMEQYAKDLSADELDTSLVEKANNKGMTFILKTKRTRHAVEGVVRGAPGLHTFTVFVPFSGKTTTSSTRKIVDVENKAVQTIESPTSDVSSVDELSSHIDDWANAVNQIESASRTSVEAAKNDSASEATPKAPRASKAASQASTSSARASKKSATSSGRTSNKHDVQTLGTRGTSVLTPPKTGRRVSGIMTVDGPWSVHQDEPEAKKLTMRYYTRVGEWFVHKVRGEYTNEDYYARHNDNDPRKAQYYTRRFLDMPPVPNHDDNVVRDVTPFFTDTIPFREEDGGVKWEYCRHRLRDGIYEPGVVQPPFDRKN